MTAMQSRARFAWRKETRRAGGSPAAWWRTAGQTRAPGRALPHPPANCSQPGAGKGSVPFKWLAPQKPKELLDGFCPEPCQEEQIAVTSNGLMLFLRLADIEWVEAVGQGVALHVGQMTHLLRATLSAVTAKLPPDRFLRLNRSTLVNIAQIKELQPAVQGGYNVLLRDGTQLHRNTDGEAHRVLSPEPKPGAR
jgi:hypothetical protein